MLTPLKRHSLRIKDYDYSLAGAYFITVCSHKRQCIFGEIKNGEMVLNEWGDIVRKEWENTEKIRKNISLSSFVVMPNHIHGILFLEGFTRPVGTIIGQFKSSVTSRLRKIAKNESLQIWQRNFYEHVIRGENDFLQICYYIENNPLQWDLDDENPTIFNP